MKLKRIALIALLVLCLSLSMLSGTALASKKKKQKATPSPAPTPVVTPAPEASIDPESPDAALWALYDIEETGFYSSPEEVATFIYFFNRLPDNYLTKAEARNLGWDSYKGNLWDVAPGMSIGGDRFGNYEGLLPTDGDYRECDVNYTGGRRQAERLIFDVTDWDVYYTADHYTTFTQLYGYSEDGAEFYSLLPEPSVEPEGFADATATAAPAN